MDEKKLNATKEIAEENLENVVGGANGGSAFTPDALKRTQNGANLGAAAILGNTSKPTSERLA